MLDLKLLQKNPEVVAAALAKRHSPLNMRTFEELDNKRRELLAQVEALKAERNRASAEVARLKRNGEDAESPAFPIFLPASARWTAPPKR